jgi:phenylpropionate dioxygenase-like ring-hydroxylating dioxygenase large terminal subunit
VPAQKRARYAATALPVREAGGLLWVFTGLDAGGTEPDVPEALTQEGWSRWIHHEDWRGHWTRAMENMLDMPHVPFVHRRTIGRGLRAQLKRDSVMHIDLEETSFGFRIRSALDGAATQGWLEWHRPNAMALYILPGAPPDRGFRQHVFCVPIDQERTRMIVVSTRTFLRHNPLGWVADQLNRRILLEDRDIVGSSQPPEVPPPGEELSVATDAPTLYFRRYYYRELRRSEAARLVPAARLARQVEPEAAAAE